MHRTITTRRYDALEAQTQRDHVALLRLFNDRANYFFGLAVKEPLCEHRGLVARAFRLAGGIAGLPR